MSGILRNTLRLVGTAKYATNNPTKYLRSMELITNRLNHSLSPLGLHNSNLQSSNDIQAKKTTNFWGTIRAAGRKILSIFVDKDEIATSNLGFFDVSLNSSHLYLITPNKQSALILPPTFSTKLNERSIQPQSNKKAYNEETSAFYLDKWHVLLDGDELTVKLKDTGETFILKHSVHVKAQKNLPKLNKDGELIIAAPRLDPHAAIKSAKITSTNESKISSFTEYPPLTWQCTPFEQFFRYGHGVPASLIEENNEEITDTPNSFGMVKLQFPMTVTLEGTPVKIKIKDSDDNFTVYHNVVIKAEKDPNVSSKTEDKKSEIGTLRMALESGNIMIESSPDTKTNQVAYIKQEVVIEIDFDSKVPSILVYPYIKYLVSVDENK
ncbi:uncharacterized protein LOC122850705 [Aphidius gifuensis]|uniref:uncharacterized protein LOC122850705 n=1 Tax=Aphidius gifuensis TaxID=684658 RepID=UPI001CDB4AF6|nr:uncharacterized protein LOC122850705 [Aphidius gifuensis]